MYGSVPRSSPFDLVVIAASQGGLAAYRQIVAGLPAGFPAAVIVLQHRPPRPERADWLPDLLARQTAMRVQPVIAGAKPAPGTVYVAPAAQQLLLGRDGRFVLADLDGAARSAGRAGMALADPLLCAAAEVFGPRVIAVVVSGRLDDGAAGVVAVKQAGGRVLVQDQASAECFGMPAAAIGTGCVDFVLPVGTIPLALVALAMAPGAARWLQVPVPSWAPLPPHRRRPPPRLLPARPASQRPG
jgi:two-component system, chemotaxis family, protein-glutamate methylesterase/glutaminase